MGTGCGSRTGTLKTYVECSWWSTWVSMHQEGQVWVRAHSGQVMLADGTEEDTKRLTNVMLDLIVEMRGMRHADAWLSLRYKNLLNRIWFKIAFCGGNKCEK